jgi:CheY-like chemotaxis protein
VADIDKMLRRLIGEHIELVTLTGRDLGHIKADPGQIEQVIMNLVVNARDAMPKGGKLTIETQNATLDENYAREHLEVAPGTYVMLAVSDTGTGMDAETRSRIFEPFFTTKEQGKGTGLGLSTVYGLVKQNGGTIWVYSEPGHGSAFKIYLPTVQEDVDLAPRLSPAPAATGSETILVVEDDLVVRKLVSTTLRKQSYVVIEAENGDDALRIVSEHRGKIHLVLSDGVMPGLQVREFIVSVAALLPEAKLLLMSGYTNEAIVRHGPLEPDIVFLQKPFTTESLAFKVREVLDAAGCQKRPED